ncbi:DNA-(apurinic or apyrimidinic site) endonuclease-like [Homarus americanus]|uniref:DNA-(apurinic or apyrimidinic site) endonuclease n=1 Tax=Homarus americanus TaxID=6706 RepID=A0A8J5MXX9_HOMAM|nr:DNA-(apurinic or apyrimidinic site) endonuclease-like [Homarus americanus]KAG7168515.1 DNA-(apurinic or apyrimidinic site) endonuclease-like [Homarus americanus]
MLRKVGRACAVLCDLPPLLQYSQLVTRVVNFSILAMPPKRKQDTNAASDKEKKESKKIKENADGDKEKKETKKSKDNADSDKEKKETKKLKKDEFSSDAKTKDGKKWNLKVVSWNVDGVRAWLKKSGLSVFEDEDPDVVCLQETKCSEGKLPEELKNIKGYKSYFMHAKKDGYSGVALYSKIEPLSVTYGINDEEHDEEGRCITAEFEKYFVVTAYVPNAGKKLVTLDKRLDWDPKFREYLQDLDAKKTVILCGDLNVSHKEIDLANPKSNKKNAGFTQEEKDGFSDLLAAGFVDSFRHLYPDKTAQYTFWTYMFNCRAKNVGWRLDYFVLSERLVPQLCDNIIRDSLYGSDHCPITLLMHM